MNDFESKVLNGLKECASCRHLGFAVSGGADSIAMLTAACQLLKEKQISAKKLFVITVNHYIRAEEETCGDAEFVLEYCKVLSADGVEVHGVCYSLEKGLVQKLSEIRGGGIEDAARYLRYEKFEQFIKDYNLDYLCMAHNQNDQLETLIMRFLQGSNGIAAAGIKAQRDKYVRPLLNVTRTEIENYLKSKNIQWRTDSTNNETDYLRNKIRHNLIPVLDSQFNGWQTGVLNGAEKQIQSAEVIQKLVDEITIDSNGSISVTDFCKYGQGVQIPLLLKLCNTVSENCRIPFVFIKDICSEISDCIESCNEKSFSKRFADLEITCKKNKIIVKKYVKTETDLNIFGIIEESKSFNIPSGVLSFLPEDSQQVSVYLNQQDTGIKVKLPVCVRNAQIGDVVKTADGNYKKVADVFSDWKAGEMERALIPVIQDLSSEQKILCILGNCAGFNNWIVKE